MKNVTLAITSLVFSGALIAGSAWGQSSAESSMSSSMSSNYGSRDNVRQVQEALRQKGFNPGPADGVMGPRTEQALRQFQQSKNISATGRLDNDTSSALGVSLTADSMGSSSSGNTTGTSGSAASGSMKGGSASDTESNMGDRGKDRSPASGNEVPRDGSTGKNSPTGSSPANKSGASSSSTSGGSPGSASSGSIKGGSSSDTESNMGDRGKDRTPASGNEVPRGSGTSK